MTIAAYEDMANGYMWPRLHLSSTYKDRQGVNFFPSSGSSGCMCMYVCILWARVQPTLDPYAEAFL